MGRSDGRLEAPLDEHDPHLTAQNPQAEALRESCAAYEREVRALNARIAELEAQDARNSELNAEREHEVALLRSRVAALSPLVSIVVICWNNRRFLKRCFDSLVKTDYPNLEIFLADNASTDDSTAFVAEHYPSVRAIVHPRNLGFAEGNNRVIRLCKGKYVVTLNPDTEVHPDWIARLVAVAEKDPTVGMLSPKMYIMDQGRRLNSAGGDMLLRSGDNVARAFYVIDDDRFNRIEETFGPSAGAGFYRRSMLDDIGLFDRGLFTYYEDVDINLRAQLRGYRCLYVPGAVVHHYQAGTLDDHHPLKMFLLQRNKWYVVLKNFPLSLLWHCRRELRSSFIGAMRHIRHTGHRKLPYKIVFSLLKKSPRILVLRIAVALRRKSGSGRRIAEWIDRHEDTYRALDQAAAVAQYYEDLRKRTDANPAR